MNDMKKIERLGLVFELKDLDYVNDYMEDHECPLIEMISAIYLSNHQIYEWKMREYSYWSYEEVGLTKEEMLSQLVHTMKIIYTIAANTKVMNQLDWQFTEMIYKLADQLATEYVCVNECVDDLYYEEYELKEIKDVK